LRAKFISMYKHLFFLGVTTFLLNHASAQGIVRISDRKADSLYEQVLEPYLSFFSALQERRYNREKFIALFDGGRINIDNDFNSIRANIPFTNAAAYTDELIRVFVINGAENYDNLEMTLPESINDMKFCYNTGVCYVWMKKTFTYRVRKKDTRTVSNWVRLKLKHIGTTYKIAEIINDREPRDLDKDNVVDDNVNGILCDRCADTDLHKGYNTIKGCINNDRDGDGITDKLDQCPDDPGGRKAKGCPDIDNDGTADKSDKCTYQKGSQNNGGCPISELIFAVDGGVNYPTGSSYSNKEFLNKQQYTWQNSGLARWGYMANLSLQYRFSSWLAIGVGEMFFSNRFDADRLGLSSEVFLTKNNASYRNVTATAANYSFHVPHVKVCLGTFWKENSVFVIEPTVGMAFNGWSKGESLLRIDYGNGNSQVDRISLKATKSFLLSGGKIGYEFWGESDGCGFSVNIFYFTGNAVFLQQEIKLADLPNTITFGNQRVQMFGGTIGFHCYLSRGKQLYKH